MYEVRTAGEINSIGEEAKRIKIGDQFFAYTIKLFTFILILLRCHPFKAFLRLFFVITDYLQMKKMNHEKKIHCTQDMTGSGDTGQPVGNLRNTGCLK